ncbi:unnamed protein product [Gulo gulo]|uniref:Synaptobrevin homolog YKT6 n=1 Tax=Gulo gulo TaxID=48420 RepID=A0A9X9PZ65_GULGU|nr:unnamed protein product [Gulo gulo]
MRPRSSGPLVSVLRGHLPCCWGRGREEVTRVLSLSVQEFMTFTSQLIVERSAKGSRASVKEQEYLCHVYVRNDSLAGVVIADSEYPSRVAFTLLEKVLDEFSKHVDRIEWPVGSPASIQYTALDDYLSRYQNPREADPMTKVQAELDETKIILHNTMESLLERGERLDDLVSKSEVLGTQSKAFYKTVSAGPARARCRARPPRTLRGAGLGGAGPAVACPLSGATGAGAGRGLSPPLLLPAEQWGLPQWPLCLCFPGTEVVCWRGPQ